MTWALVIAGAWLLVAVAVALVIGRAVREADRREGTVDGGSRSGSAHLPPPANEPRNAAAERRPLPRARHGLRHR